jgi:hypothetical protein
MKFSKLILASSLIALHTVAIAQSVVKKVITVNEGNPIIRTQDTYNYPKVTPRFVNSLAVPTLGYVDGANPNKAKVSLVGANGVTNRVRMALSKAGYTVLETKATDLNVTAPSTGSARVADAVANMNGQYANAAYVLVGTVTTSSNVHFDVLDHDSQAVKTSFDSSVSGVDLSTTKGVTAASDALGVDVVSKLKAAGIMPTNENPTVIGQDPKPPTTFVEPVPAAPAAMPLKK